MVVNHNGTQYTVTRMATKYQWKLTSVNNPRETLTLNANQMVIAGFKHAMGGDDDKSALINGSSIENSNSRISG